MDDFQLRIVRGLERLVGREADGVAPLSDRFDLLLERFDALAAGQALVAQRLAQIRERLEDIRDRMPPAGP